MVALQQAMARRGGVVMEGRDIGTVVLPDAEVKVFLTASQGERVRRRQEELAARGITLPPRNWRRTSRRGTRGMPDGMSRRWFPPRTLCVLDSDRLSADEVVGADIGTASEGGAHMADKMRRRRPGRFPPTMYIRAPMRSRASLCGSSCRCWAESPCRGRRTFPSAARSSSPRTIGPTWTRRIFRWSRSGSFA